MGKINKNCGVYQIRNILTGYCLTGQSMRLKRRPIEHWSRLKNNRHKNTHLQNSYNKHGKEFFIFEILLYCSKEDLTYYEQLFYDIDKSHNLSYNVRDCVDSNKGIRWTEETKKKISIANSGKNNPNFGKRGKGTNMWGKHHSEETIEKIRKSKIGKFVGKDNPMWGKHHSEETCKKISENNTNPSGENHYLFGKHPSEETRRKMSEAKKGKKCFKIIKKEIVLEILKLLEKGISVTEMLKRIDVSKSTVYKVKNGYYNDIYDL